MPTALTNDCPVLCFQALGAEAQIDAEKGVLRGVSVMSKGPALGHSLEVDDTTLDSIVRQGNQRDRVPVYLQHGSGLGEHVGDAVNFRRDGDKARADIELYDTHPKRGYVLEKAHKNPTSFGISSESYPPPNDPLHVPKSPGSKVRYIRSTKLDALAFVRDPATNTSLFSQPDQPETTALDMDENKLKEILDGALAPIKNELSAVKSENTALKTQLSALPDAAARATELEAATAKGATTALASCGIKPGSVPTVTSDGATTADPAQPTKTEFEKKMEELTKAGVKNVQAVARGNFPELFNQHMALQTGKAKPGAY